MTVGACLLPIALALVLWASGLAAALELNSVAVRFDLRGVQPPPKRVVLVVIDAGAVDRLHQAGWGSPPYPRRLHARAIDRMREAGAAAIGYDINFEHLTDKGRDRGPADDVALARAAVKSGRVFFAFTTLRDGSGLLLDWLPLSFDLQKEKSGAGSASYGGDGDNGVVTSMIARAAGWESLGLAAAKRAGAPANPRGSAGKELTLNFLGPPGTINRVNFADLVAPGELSPAVAAKIRGRVAVVGFDYPPGEDRPRPTLAPGAGLMSGVEIHATTAANALGGGFMVAPSAAVTIMLIILMGGAVPLAAFTLRRPAVVGVLAAALFVGFLVLAQALFANGTVIPVVAPLVAFGLSLLTWLVLGYFRSEREQRQLRRRFAAFDEGLVEGVLGGTAAGSGLNSELIIPGFRLDGVVGRGAMGVVYRAEQLDNGRAVAVKILRPELADDDLFRKRFERETRLAAALEHPNVLPVFASGENDGVLFLATRLVEGGDLAEKLREGGPFAAADALAVVTGVAAALDAAHARGLIHRDVKPGNVLIDVANGDHVYLTDFGIAQQLGEQTLTAEGSTLGTLGYAPPEQLAGGEVGPRADIYGLGALLYALLVGESPLPPALDPERLAERLAEWPPTVLSVPELDVVFERALARDPALRYETAAQLVQAARQALS